MAIFIATLAFPGNELQGAAKFGVMTGSAVAAILGLTLGYLTVRQRVAGSEATRALPSRNAGHVDPQRRPYPANRAAFSLPLSARTEAPMRDKTKAWLERVGVRSWNRLPVPALLALLVFDSIFLLRIYVALVFVAYIAGLPRK